MNVALSPVVMLGMIKREQIKRECEKSLICFIKNAWSVIEPGTEFVDNWHLHAIASHLEALSNDEIENLVIAIPPGCMKSILVSVALPAWEWIRRPELRYMGASYGVDLSIRDSQKCRDIITSEWYQNYWPHVQIKPGEDQKTKYSLTAGGWRMATSVGGRATGEHPDRKIVDDPHNAKQAESDLEREAALTWFDRTLSTRGQSRGAKTIVVAQRFHERDLTGHILADIKGYDYLCIPMEYEKTDRKTSIGWSDPRTYEGELLWPELFPSSSVEQLKVLLGAYGVSGQFQQTPTPAGGGILKTDCFRLWPASKSLPDLFWVGQSLDTAFTEKTTGDPTAFTCWGIFEYEKRRHVLLLDCWQEQLGYPKLKERVIADWGARYGGEKDNVMKPSRRPDIILIENKGSGQSLIQDLRQSNIPVTSYNPGRADKVARAHMVAPLLESGCVWVLESNKNAGRARTWAQPFLDQCERFPMGAHDDYVDTFTQMMIYLKDSQQLEIVSAPEEEPDEIDYDARKRMRVNPYG